MDKVERLTYLFTRQIKERPTKEDFSEEEYKQLIRNIHDWCGTELRGGKRKGERGRVK